MNQRHRIPILLGFIISVLLIQSATNQPKSNYTHILLREVNGSHSLHADLSHLIPHGLTLAVVTLVHNEGRYLREWIEFHLLMGVQLFIIFDDNSTDNTPSIVTPYIQSHVVLLVHAKDSFYECAHRNPHRSSHLQADCQRAAFNYARSQLIGRTAWMGNFDVDEFIYTPENAPPLQDILENAYKDYDRISVTGLVFGSNNHSRPTKQPVIEAFTRCARMDPALDQNGYRFGHKELYRPERVFSSDIHNTLCWPGICQTAVVSPLADDIRMNHYQYKSREERRAKALLNGNSVIEIDSTREAVLDEVEESGIQYIIPKLTSHLQHP
jgi:hypothetical protein